MSDLEDLTDLMPGAFVNFKINDKSSLEAFFSSKGMDLNKAVWHREKDTSGNWAPWSTYTTSGDNDLIRMPGNQIYRWSRDVLTRV